MAEYLQAPPRKKALGLLADTLTSGQNALNTVNVPYLGGLGGLLFGQAPQYLEDISYGMPAFRGGNVATGGLGTLTPDTRMLDVATLPFVGAGAAKAGQVGAKTLGKEVARQVETGTGLLGSNVLDPRQYATAYHGSPAIFNKFDLKKAGNNSGQDYGYGTYFSPSPDVANAYTKAFGSKNNKDVGNVYKVDIPDEYMPKMINWSSYKQTPEVKEIFKKNGLSAEGSGEDLYFEAIKKAGSSDENKSGFQKAAEYLDSIGIKGVTYPNRAVGDTKDAQNYVLFNPSQIKILETTKGLLD
jgi:hypothetical protein